MTGQQPIQWLEHMSKTEDLKKKIMAALDDRLKLLMFTDTDSLCYVVKTPDIYKDMEEHVDKVERMGYGLCQKWYSSITTKDFSCVG